MTENYYLMKYQNINLQYKIRKKIPHIKFPTYSLPKMSRLAVQIRHSLISHYCLHKLDAFPQSNRKNKITQSSRMPETYQMVLYVSFYSVFYLILCDRRTKRGEVMNMIRDIKERSLTIRLRFIHSRRYEMLKHLTTHHQEAPRNNSRGQRVLFMSGTPTGCQLWQGRAYCPREGKRGRCPLSHSLLKRQYKGIFYML